MWSRLPPPSSVSCHCSLHLEHPCFLFQSLHCLWVQLRWPVPSHPCAILDHMPWVDVSYFLIPRAHRVSFYMRRLVATLCTTFHCSDFLHVNLPFPSRTFSHWVKHHAFWECKLVQPLWRTVWRFLKKLEIELPYDPAIPLLGIYTEKP